MELDADVDLPAEPEITNVSELLARRAQEQPDLEAVVDYSRAGGSDQAHEDAAVRRTTWFGLDRRVDAVADGLTALGLVGGRRVGLIGSNDLDFVVGYLAALRAGLVAVPLDPRAPDAELARQLTDCGAHHALSNGTGRELPGVELLTLDEDGLSAIAAGGHSPIAVPPDPEALAVLIATAGTSGEPRTVMLSHRALLAHLNAVNAYGIVDAGTRVLGALPFSHIFGLNTVLGGWLAAGARLVLSAPDARAILAAVEAEQVTTLPLTPRLLFDLMAEPSLVARLGSVRTVLCAAAPVPWGLAREFTERTGLRVEQGYGLTEAAPGVSATLGYELLGPAHVGRALPGVEIAVSPMVDAGEPGPILVRGQNLFSGYWPNGDGGPDEDGWFDTGDIGYLTGPDLFLIDRARELVVIGGFTVYPTEIEQAVRDLAGVRAVAAVGVAPADAAAHLVVFVAGDVSVQQVSQHCERRLAPFKRPAHVRIVDDLPRGITGKVRRAELRRWAQQVGTG